MAPKKEEVVTAFCNFLFHSYYYHDITTIIATNRTTITANAKINRNSNKFFIGPKRSNKF